MSFLTLCHYFKNFPFVYSCFLSDARAFWGAFLAPILAVMLFNLIIFVCVIVVLIRKHIKRSKEFGKKRVDNKLFLRLFVGISGVMFLFGLTWLFATLSISVQVLREIAQILFTLTNSFQGLFIFLFLCVISSDARDEWKKVLMSMKPKPWFSLSPSSKETVETSIGMTNTMSCDTKEMTLNLSEVNIILDMAFGMNCNH